MKQVKCKSSRVYALPCLYSIVYTQLVFHRSSHSPSGAGASTPQGGGWMKSFYISLFTFLY